MRAVAILMFAASIACAKPARDPVALVVVIDRSTTMGKAGLEAAKEAVRAAAATLTRDDRIAVIGFDDTADIYVPLVRADETKAIDILLRKLVRGDAGCDVRPGLEQADDLLADVRGMRKHVVVVIANKSTDDGLGARAKALDDHRVSLSAVGLSTANQAQLGVLTNIGNGRLYVVEDLGVVPKILIKEVRAVFLTK